MQETSNPRSLGSQQPNGSGSGSKSRAALADLASLIGNTCLRATRILTEDIIVFSLTLYTAYAYGVIFSYFASANYILARDYNFDLRQVGLSFISVIIGYLLAAFTFAIFDATLYARAHKHALSIAMPGAEPEHRLYAALLGSGLLSGGLFW